MFYVTAALAVVCIAGALVFVEPDHPSTELDKRVDWLGAFFVTSGLVLIVFVLSDGEVAPQQWRTPCTQSVFFGHCICYLTYLLCQLDIIALLVIGVFFLALFILWQWYLERPSARNTYSRWTPPPLMKLSLWRRGNGKFAVMQCIVLCLMSAFQSWMFWAIVSCIFPLQVQTKPNSHIELVILPELSPADPRSDNDQDVTDDSCRDHMQRHHWSRHWKGSCDIPHM